MKETFKTAVRPARLVPGDTIGIVAPASPFDPVKYQQGLSFLESIGFHTLSPDDVFQKSGYLAGSDRHRAESINRLFADTSVKAIVCARGGFGSLRILPLLDFSVIQKNPKIFMGFSDISAILSVLHTRCNLVVFHGPMVTTLENTSPKTKAAMLSAVSSDIPLQLKPSKPVSIRPGFASGPVTGGNLTTLCHLLGTAYVPNTTGNILFLEDRGEAVYRIDRMLTQMRLAGFFDGIAGLVLGSFEQCGAIDDIYGVVKHICQDRSFPILAGFEIGHGQHNITIPIGLTATLDTEKKVLSFHQASTVIRQEPH